VIGIDHSARFVLACVLVGCTLHAEKLRQFSFSDFSSTSGLNLVASTKKVNNRLRLTAAREQTNGGAWYFHKQPVASGFDTEFRFQLTEQGGLGNGADGLAFVLQSSGPSAIAGRGSSGGFALGDGQGNKHSQGIPNSIAVFFDTFRNDEAKDPSANYVAVCTNGKIGKMRWPPARLGVVPKLAVDLKDGDMHTVRIHYVPPVLSVYLDNPNQPVLTVAVDLSPVLDEAGDAYVGFTASTGGGYENHDILSWSFETLDRPHVASNMSTVDSKITYRLDACLADRNLCTPERASVQEVAPGRFHIVLPAHLEWGASVPNPNNRPVAISNVHGTVCWDLAARGADGCAHDATTGALIHRTRDGRTQFSMKDQSGAFADNQGFFEFDVQLQ
jgi:hypothetical protein